MQLDPPRIDLPYKGTADTVSKMMAFGRGQHGELSLPVRMWVEDVIRYVRPRDEASQLAAIYYAFIPRFRYVHDPRNKEQVKSPERLVREMQQYGVCLGDCDDASTFLWAAPRTIGIRTELARVGFREQLAGDRPRYSHVFTVGYDQYGRALAMDPVAGLRTPRMLQRATVGVLGLGGI